MEKPERESDSPEPYDSSDAQVGEEIAEKKPQQQQVLESQMQDEQMLEEIAKETKNETSESLTGSASHEKVQILQSKIEQDEESKQSVSEEPAESAGMKHESLICDSEKQSTVQATTQIQKVAATKRPSESSGAMNCRLTIAAIVERVMNELPTERIPESSVILAWMEEEQNMPESDRCSESASESFPSEESEQKSPVREAQQATELVLEEAAICYAGQELMKEAEEPSGTISCRLAIEDIVERVSDVPVERTTESSKMTQMTTASERSEGIRARVEEQNVPESDRCSEAGSESLPSEESEQESSVHEAQQVTELVLEEAAICYTGQEPMKEAEEPSGTISSRLAIEDIVERLSNVPVELTTESSKMTQTTTANERSEEIRSRMVEEQNVPELNRCLEAGSESHSSGQSEQESPVREAQQMMELVLEEAAICYVKHEPMEEAEDIKDPQKYAFRDKDLD